MSEYYAVQRSENSLQHYGIKGMKWGVRKAIASGNSRALGRQYKKAVKKLAKLEKRATSGKKYAKRAAALGAGAAVAGGLAVAGTSGVSSGLRKVGAFSAKTSGKVGMALAKSKNKKLRNAGLALMKGGQKAASGVSRAGIAVDKWGRQYALSRGAQERVANVIGNTAVKINKHGGNITNKQLRTVGGKAINVTNNQLARIGAAGIAAGLGVAAGRNAYKAATAKRYQKKAAAFKTEMNRAFAGTQYANGAPRQGKKRKKT